MENSIKNVSLAELKNIFMSLVIQLDTLSIVISETDLRRVISVDWLNDIDEGYMKVQFSDNAELPSKETFVKNYMTIHTKEEMIKFFSNIRMMKLEPFTHF